MTPTLLDEKLPELLSKAEHLPSLPVVAVEVLRLSRDEEASIDTLAETISRDPALVVKLLKLANSPLFNSGGEIHSVREATMRLGLRTVQLMSLGFSLASTLPKQGATGAFRFPEYWRRGLLLAVAGRSMAAALGHPSMAGEAFVCGLLGNIGQLVMAQCLPELYAPVLAAAGEGWPTRALEEEHLGFAHCDVGYVLLEQWGLPRSISQSVLCMSGDAERSAGIEPVNPQLVEVMQIARIAVHVLCDEDRGTPLVELHRRSKVFGLAPREIAGLLLDLESDVSETAELLNIELPEAQSHTTIMDEARRQILHLSLNTASEASRLQTENRELQSRASTDKLTGLANRAAFDMLLEQQIRERLRGNVPGLLGLLVLDIDHFKRFNDTYGHQAGDAVLAAVGKLLAEVTRAKDTPARYGGEEFVVVVPLATPGILAVIAERIRATIEDLEVPWDGRTLGVTMSIGGACLDEPGTPEGGAKLVRAADEQLYRSKSAGRNQITIAPDALSF